eukprot:TRINITY_DN1028_c0_g1_i5.p1 TRINITY_DN1028_c0_g1~~TRINITY_DN1028_c0_g1_i5.p1  ORF type:complete len:136 (+),score=4.85 TRINITY_DN1028_c0_g1_i5:117-524(+)
MPVFYGRTVNRNTAFYLSGRKSTLPLFFSKGEELENEDGEPSGVTINEPPDDHDYQGKWIWDINHKNALTLSFTGAKDSVAAGFNQRADLSLKIQNIKAMLISFASLPAKVFYGITLINISAYVWVLALSIIQDD